RARKTAADHLRDCGARFLSRCDDIRADRKRDVGVAPEPAIIRLEAELPIQGRRLPESRDDFRARHGEMLARPDVEGDALPAPGTNPQTQGHKRLDLRVRGYALFRSVPAKLTAHDVIHGEAADGFEDLDLLVANRFAVGPSGRFHRQVAQDLEQMVLNYVANGAGFVVERAAPLDAEIFGHRDLHALDAIPVPERLDEAVGEADEQHVMHRPFAQVMVDAEDRALVEAAEQRAVEGLGRREIATERLFDDHASAVRAAQSTQLIDDQRKQRWRYREVVGRTLGGAELFANGLERARLPVVAIDVAQQPAQLRERHGIESAVLLDAVAGSRPELVQRPARFRHADDRHIEMAAFHHRLQSGKDFLVGEIARRAEEHQ